MLTKRDNLQKRNIEEIVRRAFKKVLPAIVEGKRSDPQLINITDRNEIKQNIGRAYELILKSYKEIGGFLTARSEKALYRQTTLLTIYGDEDETYAVGAYSGYLGGNKLCAIGSDETPTGKLGVRLIIQRDIREWDGWYWCEASGAVEYLFNQNGGYNIPSLYASEILQRNDIQIIDEYHYIRSFGPEHEPIEKTIFGFRDKEIYDKVTDYLAGRNSHTVGFIQNESRKLQESSASEEERVRKNVFLAISTIGSIFETLGELRMTDMIPEQAEALKKSVSIIKQHPEYKNAEQMIELAEYMLETYPVLELHRFG
ncbi:MAG: hypothetical protein LUD72_00105 [Bacteroidales bacterium]|nr:hypothetical protein [Bacteroidales bacterium]